jgi:outer membrane immunogenic protein
MFMRFLAYEAQRGAFMLRQEAGGPPPKNQSRRRGLVKPSTAVNILALACAVSVGSANAAEGPDRPRGTLENVPEPVVDDRSDPDFGGQARPTFTADTDGVDRRRASVDEVQPPAVYNWSGLYLGGHAIPPFTGDTDGMIAGGHIGFNGQLFQWVVGLEASLSDSDLDAPQTELMPDTTVMGVHITGATLTNSFDVDGLFLAMARLGYAGDRWLTYVTGGYAAATLKTSQTASGTAMVELQGRRFPLPFEVEGRTSERHHGWTIGAGLEYALTANIIFGLEYNLIDLGSTTHRGSAEAELNGMPLEPLRLSANVDPEAVHTGWARLSFKFGGKAAPKRPAAR